MKLQIGKKTIGVALAIALVAVFVIILLTGGNKADAVSLDERRIYGVNCFDILAYDGEENVTFAETETITKAAAVKYIKDVPASYGVDNLAEGEFVFIERPMTKESRYLQYFLIIGDNGYSYMYKDIVLSAKKTSAGEDMYNARIGFYMPAANVNVLAIYGAKWDKRIYGFNRRSLEWDIETDISTTIPMHLFPVEPVGKKVASVFANDPLNNQLHLEELNGKYKIAGGNTDVFATYREDDAPAGIKAYINEMMIGSFVPGEQVLYKMDPKAGQYLESAEVFTFDERGDKKPVKAEIFVANIIERTDEDSYDDAATKYEKKDVIYFVMPEQEREVHIGNLIYKTEQIPSQDAAAAIKVNDETVREGNLFVTAKDVSDLANTFKSMPEEKKAEIRENRVIFSDGEWFTQSGNYTISKSPLGK